MGDDVGGRDRDQRVGDSAGRATRPPRPRGMPSIAAPVDRRRPHDGEQQPEQEAEPERVCRSRRRGPKTSCSTGAASLNRGALLGAVERGHADRARAAARTCPARRRAGRARAPAGGANSRPPGAQAARGARRGRSTRRRRRPCASTAPRRRGSCPRAGSTKASASIAERQRLARRRPAQLAAAEGERRPRRPASGRAAPGRRSGSGIPAASRAPPSSRPRAPAPATGSAGGRRRRTAARRRARRPRRRRRPPSARGCPAASSVPARPA